MATPTARVVICAPLHHEMNHLALIYLSALSLFAEQNCSLHSSTISPVPTLFGLDNDARVSP